MKILFAMMHPGYMRYYQGALRVLAERGHRIHLAFDIPHKQAKDKLELRLAEEFPSVTTGQGPRWAGDWEGLARALAWGMDYLRYFTPTYRTTPRLRLRVEVVIHPTFRRAVKALPRWAVRPAIRALMTAYDLVLPSPEYLAFLREHAPDVVLVTPLITQGASFQSEYVRAAKALGIPVAYCVASWDNLTTKGLIRGHPDRVILWNDVQRREAIEMHGIPASRVVTTGAQLFDPWFEYRPSTSREEFCRRVGLSPDRPFVLYMCSSNFMAPNEPPFTLRWLDALRTSADPAIRNLGVLVRPYPEHFAPWTRVDTSSHRNFAIWPRDGSYPLTADSRADFFDAIHHSVAVVGVNTSALIETAIIGRPVLTILAEEFRASQRGTLHFHYLLKDNGGFLEMAADLPQHLDQLAAVLTDQAAARERTAAFVGRFVRPHGLKRPATPTFVAAVEALETLPRCACRPSLGRRGVQGVLASLARRVSVVRSGAAFREHAERWKVASRRAEEIGGDPLEVWAQMHVESGEPDPEGVLDWAFSVVSGRISRRLRRWRGGLNKRLIRYRRRRQAQTGSFHPR